MREVTRVDVLSFDPHDESDQRGIILQIKEVLNELGFDLFESESKKKLYLFFEIPFEGSESLVYPIYLWVDCFCMLNLEIRVAGEPQTPLSRRYFKTMEYLKTYFPTGISVNKDDGQCYWSWKGIPLRPETMADTLVRVLEVVQHQLGHLYEVFCLLDEGVSDNEALQKARAICEVFEANSASEYYN